MLMYDARLLIQWHYCYARNDVMHLESLSVSAARKVPYPLLHFQSASEPGFCYMKSIRTWRLVSMQLHQFVQSNFAGDCNFTKFSSSFTFLIDKLQPVLCCVDKQGILSWPNPSPETVLFFSGRVEPPHDSLEDLKDDLSMRSFLHPEMEEEKDELLGDDLIMLNVTLSQILTLSGVMHEVSKMAIDHAEADALLPTTGLEFVHVTNEMGQDKEEKTESTPRLRKRSENRRCKHLSGSNVSFSKDTEGGEDDVTQVSGIGEDLGLEAEDYICDYHLEMLSLSQDQQNPASIQFDDSNWQFHISSLKPLGLNILLNLCYSTVTEQ
eukprot:g45489.t1